jgi:hypothetical protein
MSLTSQLNDPESLLSAFMAAQFPQVKEFSAVFRAVRPADGEALQPPVEAGTRVAWGTVNAAIDHRLRYAFADSARFPKGISVSSRNQCGGGPC